MPYRIGRSLEKNSPSQVVAPLTCYLLSAFDRHDVPIRFAVLRDALNDIEVRREEYISEVVRLLQRIPNMMCVEGSKFIRDLAETSLNKSPQVVATRMYLLAFLLPKQDAYIAMWPKGMDMQTYMQVCAGIQKQRDLARTRVDLILQTLLRLELEDRFWVVSRIIDAPFYVESGNPLVLVGLAHYHPPFVQEFKKTVKPFVRNVDRAHELVSMDFNLFVAALQHLPPQTSDMTKRVEDQMFGAQGHPYASRIVWAFCSVWFVECYDTFRAVWNLPPETMKRLWSMSMQGKTITLLEATRPFGSSGTLLSS